jgi:hypothetical protein
MQQIALTAYLAVLIFGAVSPWFIGFMTHPAAYFITWDMFPGYYTRAVRYRVLAQDAETQEWLQLSPGPRDQYTQTRTRIVHRLDLDRPGAVVMKYATRVARRESAATGRRFNRVVVVGDIHPLWLDPTTRTTSLVQDVPQASPPTAP